VSFDGSFEISKMQHTNYQSARTSSVPLSAFSYRCVCVCDVRMNLSAMWLHGYAHGYCGSGTSGMQVKFRLSLWLKVRGRGCAEGGF
jgi:hypothetical protein